MENQTYHRDQGVLRPAPCPHTGAPTGDGYCPDCGAPRQRSQAQLPLSREAGLPLGRLIPVRSWWEDRSWRTGMPFAFLTLALLPFLIDHLSFGHAKWGFAVYFAGIWFFAIRALVKPEMVSHWRLARIALFTAVVGIPLAIALEGHAGMSSSFMHYVFGVGVPEELAKALPVFLFVFLARQVHFSPRTYVYIGAVSGLVFGAVEAARYSDVYAALSTFDSNSLMNEVWRIAADPVMHACWAGICCYFIGLASTHRSKQVPLIALGLGIAALLHGAYDTTASGWLGVAVFAVSLFVFVGYVLSAERIAHDYLAAVVESGPIEQASTGTRGVPTGAVSYPVFTQPTRPSPTDPTPPRPSHIPGLDASEREATTAPTQQEPSADQGRVTRGSKLAARTGVSPIICANGHPASAGDRFCGLCGVLVPPAVRTDN
jgi:RsiW-degrading membrane proteinase PrsW (M82 family)